jgi:hypothetical protein
MSEDEVKRASDYKRLDELENKMLQMQIDSLRKDSDDHEQRVRVLEDTATKFNFILYLTMGGGFISLVNLATLVALFVKTIER